MPPEIQQAIDEMLRFYTQEKYRNELIEAKKIYAEKTGQLNDEDDEYEHRMNLFNMWYLFDYSFSAQKTIAQDYVEMEELSASLTESLLNVQYGVFELVKFNRHRRPVLADLINGGKKTINTEFGGIGLVEEDLFTARICPQDQLFVMLPGLCTLPGVVKKRLKKEAKKIRKHKQDSSAHLDFLLQLEQLKAKSRTYAHVEPSKIFVFDGAS